MIVLALSVWLTAPVTAECLSDRPGLRWQQDGLAVEIDRDVAVFVDPVADNSGSPAAEELIVLPSVSGTAVASSLRLGELWTLWRDGAEISLEVPETMRRGPTALLLSTPEVVWLRGRGTIARIDLVTAQVAVLPWRAKAAPMFLAEPEAPLLVAGNELWRCCVETGCQRRQRLDVRVDALVLGRRGRLLAVSGSGAGLYRATGQGLDSLTLLVAGSVERMCDLGDGEALVLSKRGDERRLVAAADVTPAVRVLTWAEVVDLAVQQTRELTPASLAAVLALAERGQWPNREALFVRMARDHRVELRRVAAAGAAGVRGAQGTALLWLLAHDADPEVREAALNAAALRCPEDPSLACRSVLRWFLDDSDAEISWLARDRLLPYAPKTAITGASQDYQLSAIARLASLAQGDVTGPAARMLGRLAQGSDPLVSEAARLALEGVLP